MFTGSIPALVTPFSKNEVDYKALENLLEWHVDQGSNGIVAVGTTGESPTLSHEEHKNVIEFVVQKIKKRITVIAGTGSNNTSESLELTKFSEKIGADAALIVTPYYNKPNQKGIYEHFKILHDNSNIPIILYNIPSRSIIDIKNDTMRNLSRLSRIIGIKDATGDIGRVSDTRQKCGKNFIQLCGNDEIALGFNAHGGVGCISVIANLAPRISSDFQKFMLNGDFLSALKIQDKLLPLHRAAFIEPNPAPIKYGLKLLGFCNSDIRLPLTDITDKSKEEIKSAMKFAGLI